jgi:hypothetical protein
MTRLEWLNYRDELLDNYLKAGNILRPNVRCSACDPRDDYTCLICEIAQVDDGVKL